MHLFSIYDLLMSHLKKSLVCGFSTTLNIYLLYLKTQNPGTLMVSVSFYNSRTNLINFQTHSNCMERSDQR